MVKRGLSRSNEVILMMDVALIRCLMVLNYPSSVFNFVRYRTTRSSDCELFKSFEGRLKSIKFFQN